MATPGTASVLNPERTTLRYPNARVIVLNDDVNTFEHVVECLCKIIPGMNSDKAWTLAHQIDGEGAAEVWAGPLSLQSFTTNNSAVRDSQWLHWNAINVYSPIH